MRQIGERGSDTSGSGRSNCHFLCGRRVVKWATKKTKRERAESGDVFKNYVCASKKESVLHRTYSTHLHTLRKKTPAGNRFWMVSMSAWLAPSSPLSCPAI